MTKQQFADLLVTIQREELQVREEGQNEYARDESDCFANFSRVAMLRGTTKENILLVYLLKHIDGISSYVDGHRSQREDIRGRIKDARMYLALLWGMIEEDRFIEQETSQIDVLEKQHEDFLTSRISAPRCLKCGLTAEELMCSKDDPMHDFG